MRSSKISGYTTKLENMKKNIQSLYKNQCNKTFYIKKVVAIKHLKSINACTGYNFTCYMGPSTLLI
jgi:ribonucleotide reductase beta subunit family protein with ferritin-like domain